MPPFLVPRKTSTHRVAAIALYRALLGSCTSVPVAAEERQFLRNVVRNKFRSNQQVHSSRLLAMAFQSGYDTLDMFDRAMNGDTASTAHISELLEQTPSHLKRPPRPPRIPKKPEGRPAAACPPPEQKLLNTRPYMSLSGRRKIPKLRVHNGVPFLMYRKPQPANLGRMLRFQTLRAQRRQNALATVEHDLAPPANQEDFWDNLLEATFGVGDCDNPDAHVGEGEDDEEGPTWITEVAALESHLLADWKQSKVTRSKTAKLFQAIVDREEVLAKKEKEERKALKRMKRGFQAKCHQKGTKLRDGVKRIKIIDDDQF